MVVADWAVGSEAATAGAVRAADWAAARAVVATAEAVKAEETAEAGSEEDLPIRT